MAKLTETENFCRSHHAVAEVLRNVAVETGYCIGSYTMMAGNGLALLLWIEKSGDRCRADQVAEQHRRMAPLAFCGCLNYGGVPTFRHRSLT
jgi:hypothetical protein